MIKIVHFITCIAVTLGSTTDNVDMNRIMNGEDAQEHEFPYQVSLRECRGHFCNHLCGGVIISPTAVLTAAHCCLSNTTYSILAGTIHLPDRYSSSFRIITASGFTRHEMYKVGYDGLDLVPYDICIVHLKKSLTYSTYIRPATLPISDAPPSGLGVLAGWGSTGSIYPHNLKKLTAEIITNNECENEIRTLLFQDNLINFVNNSNVVCTSGRGSVAACRGDTGSPLVQNGIVIGVVATICIMPGRLCAIPNSPTVYTAVNPHIDWIKSHVSDLNKEADQTTRENVGFLSKIFGPLLGLFKIF